MNTEIVQKLILSALGLLLLIIVLFFLLPALMRGKGNITIQTAPGGAQIVVDGKTYKSPAKLTNIAAGSHKVEVTLKGFKSRTDKVLVEKDKSTKITLRLYSSVVTPTAVRAGLDEVSKIKSDLEKIAPYLPYIGDGFKIDLVVTGREPTVKITLYARLNKPSQYERFKKEIKAFSKEALGWIRSKGADPANLDIKWEPVDPNKF